eukprot:119454-Chlamydomonas_euryale.AAC.1
MQKEIYGQIGGGGCKHIGTPIHTHPPNNRDVNTTGRGQRTPYYDSSWKPRSCKRHLPPPRKPGQGRPCACGICANSKFFDCKCKGATPISGPTVRRDDASGGGRATGT